MQGRHRGVAHFHRQITTRDHDAVAGFHDVGERFGRDRFGALNFGDQQCVATGRSHQLACHVHVRAVLWKRYGQKIRANRHRRLDVLHVFGGQRRRRKAATLAIDALVVRQHAADQHLAFDALAAHRHHLEDDQAIVE